MSFFELEKKRGANFRVIIRNETDGKTISFPIYHRDGLKKEHIAKLLKNYLKKITEKDIKSMLKKT